MKTIRIRALAGILTIFLLAFTSCEKNTAEAGYTAPFLLTSSDGISAIDEERLVSALGITPDLSPEELNLLISMREEEKLARDVYSVLGEKWGHPVFARISAAENTHMKAVNSLLRYYGSPDTLISDPGIFTDPEVQSFYNELISKGSVSTGEAFMTGALVEEKDIKDLREAIQQTSNENIIMVLSNLERGSRNHLRAFNRQLKIRSISYDPVYISRDEYETIVNSPVEAGNRYRMNSGRPCRFGK